MLRHSVRVIYFFPLKVKNKNQRKIEINKKKSKAQNQEAKEGKEKRKEKKKKGFTRWQNHVGPFVKSMPRPKKAFLLKRIPYQVALNTSCLQSSTASGTPAFPQSFHSTKRDWM